MLSRNDAVMHFLLTRRSKPAKTLSAPVPNKKGLLEILNAAARTPDHGKLVPWRFIILQEKNTIKPWKTCGKYRFERLYSGGQNCKG